MSLLSGWLALILVAGTTSTSAPEGGIVLEEVQEGYPGDQAGLRPGDVLTRWSRGRKDGPDPVAAEGDLHSPFELTEVGFEELPRGAVTLEGFRNGTPFSVVAPAEAVGLGLRSRPALPAALLDAYERGIALVREEKAEEGAALWH